MGKSVCCVCVVELVNQDCLNLNFYFSQIDVSRALIGQALGGLIFAVFSGQHMIVLGVS